MNDHTDAARTAPTAPRSGALLFEPGSRVSSARDVAEVVFRHWRYGLAVFGAVLVLSTAFIYLTPPVYESTAKVLVERGKMPTLRTDTLQYQLDAFEAITSEIEIIKSRTVAEDVVDRLGLAERPQRDTWMRRLGEGVKDSLDRLGLLTRLDRRESVIRSVLDGLKVEPAPQSSVLVISYSAESAADAAEITNAVTESSLEQHRKVFGSDTAAFFEERVKDAATELEQMRDRLRRDTDVASSQRLRLEVGVLEKAYIFYREKLNTARADMAADASLMNLRIIDRPVVAARPARSRMLLLLFAAGGGLLLSISLVLLRVYFDHNIYSERDIEESLNLPALGSVSYLKPKVARVIGAELQSAPGSGRSVKSSRELTSLRAR